MQRAPSSGKPAFSRFSGRTPQGIAAIAVAAAACLSAASPASCQENAARRGKPNIVVILADDLGAKELSCYGHPAHRTPNLDALAAGGVKFETCYTAPICHPTRFEIMTGQYGHHNRVFHFPGRPGGPASGSPEDDIARHLTFAQVLKPAGYATAQTGKWQLTGKVPTLINECGFDEYCMWAYKNNLPDGVEHTGGWEGAAGGKTSRYWHPSIVKNSEYLPTKADDYGPDIFCNFAIDFIRRHKDEPLFVYYPMALTHAPYYATPDTVENEADKWKNSKENFQANVEYMDKLVGRIVAALDELGLRENTVVIFTGDNGTGGEGKGQTTELGARVPMIVNAPGIVKSIGTTGELIDTSDVLPTMAGFAGIKLPEDHVFDGHNFAPFLKGQAEAPREWVYAYLGGRRVLRTKRWLLENDAPDQPGAFFDCGTSRDGSGYRDVTDSTEPEVLAAKKLFAEILADKPVPSVAEEKPAKKKQGQGQKGREKAKAAEEE
jgi:arylsulfatase A